MKEPDKRGRSAVPADNMQKYENYKEQFKRLNRALANGFNLEAIFMSYAILEDRTESILRHGELWDVYRKSRKGREPNLDSKVKYIQKRAENRLHRRPVCGILVPAAGGARDPRDREAPGPRANPSGGPLWN